MVITNTQHVNDAYSTKELMTFLRLGAPSSITRRAEREGWISRPLKKRGGGKKWVTASMPEQTQAEIARGILSILPFDKPAPLPKHIYLKEAKQAAPQMDAKKPFALAPLPKEVVITSLTSCTEKQKETALARLALLRELEKVAAVTGKEAAISHLLDAAKNGSLLPHIANLIPKANEKYKDGEKRSLSRRRLYTWSKAFTEKGELGLVPKKREKDMRIPEFAETFMRFYQKPQKPSLALAYRDFCAEWAAIGKKNTPSYDTIRRFLQKIALPEREAGRKTGNALLPLRPYKCRDTSHLLPTDVYPADGTTFDAEVQHPQSGNPFKPEITCVIDIATRKLVAVSVALSENAFAILDALRIACVNSGIPAFFYTDNGPGYKNSLMQGKGIGMLARLGIEMTNSIPGRPQGKGLMERAIKTICTDAVKCLPSCTHAALPKTIDQNTQKYRNMTPSEMWDHLVSTRQISLVLAPKELEDDLFMPSELRKARNGMVQFYRGRYYADELANFHGDTVEVRYDISNNKSVHIYTLQGEKICTAKLDGNLVPYFTTSRIEAAREKREKAQVKRLQTKADSIVKGARIELPSQNVTYTLADSQTRSKCQNKA